MLINKALNFIKRDFYNATSYRLQFLMSFFGIFISVSMFFFISKLFGRAMNPYLSGYGGDYFSFVLIGIAFSGFVTTGMNSYSASISSAQSQGTLEAMLVTPTKLSNIIIFSSMWNYFFNTINILVYLLVGYLLYGLSLDKANIPSALIVLILSTLIFSGIGVMSASFTMVFKRGNPIEWVYGMASSLLSGMFFPITVLPAAIRPVAYVLPIFYALKAMRLAVLQGFSVVALAGEITALLVMVSIILPFAIWSFKYAVRQAKKDGSLVTY